MNLVERVKNIVLQPKEEWVKIADEEVTPQSLYVGYIMILAAIGPVMLLIVTGGFGFLGALIRYVVALAATYLIALLVDALAPTFGGQKNFNQALKLVAYSLTAAWIAGILLIIPFLGALLVLVAAIYSWYTFYLGVPLLMKCPADKAAGYTVVVVLSWIVLVFIVGGLLTAAMLGGSMMGMGTMGMFR